MKTQLVMAATLLVALSVNAKEPLKVDQSAEILAHPLMQYEVKAGEKIKLLFKPTSETVMGLSEALPDNCILSIDAELAGGKLSLDTTKMLCISEDRRVLDGNLDGYLSDEKGSKVVQANCIDNACKSAVIRKSDEYALTLNGESVLGLQLRADGLSQ